MGIALFVIALVSNIFIILIMRYGFTGNYEYKQGMLLGVHIPQENIGDEEVVSLMEKAKRNYKIFQNVNVVLGIVICFVNFLNMIIFVLIWCVWLIGYAVGIELLIIMPHRKMYDIKIKNKWVIESQKRIYADTSLSAGRGEVKLYYHLIPICSEIVTGIILWAVKGRTKDFNQALILLLITLLVSLISFVFNVAFNKRERTVYSKDTTVNQAVNNTVKKYIFKGMLITNIINALSWLYIFIEYIGHSRITDADYYVYMGIQFMYTLVILWMIIIIGKKKEEILNRDNEPLYVDDDEYWKTGFYNNPADPKVLVKNRLSDTNYSFNLGNKAGKAIMWSLEAVVAGFIIWFVAIMIPYINVHIDTEIKDNYFTVKAVGYEFSINIDDIEEVQLMDKMPKDSFTRTNGGATEEYNIGNYKGNTYGKCMLFIWNGYGPVVMIKGDNKTVFVNYKEDGAALKLYEQLSNADIMNISK